MIAATRRAVLAGGTVLAGCDGPPPLRLDARAAGVRRILVLPPEFRPGYPGMVGISPSGDAVATVPVGTDPATAVAGALIAGLFVGAVEAAGRRRFPWVPSMLKGRAEIAARSFAESLSAALRARGFEVLGVPVPQDRAEAWDAALVTRIEALDYLLNPIVGPMTPKLTLWSRLLRRDSGAELMSIRLFYEYGLSENTPAIGRPAHSAVIPQDPAFRFQVGADEEEDRRRFAATLEALMARAAGLVADALG